MICSICFLGHRFVFFKKRKLVAERSEPQVLYIEIKELDLKNNNNPYLLQIFHCISNSRRFPLRSFFGISLVLTKDVLQARWRYVGEDECPTDGSSSCCLLRLFWRDSQQLSHESRGCWSLCYHGSHGKAERWDEGILHVSLSIWIHTRM